MFRPGRIAAKPEILGTRELTRAEVLTIKRAPLKTVKTFRDSHHMVARLFAMGLRPGEVKERTGYSHGRISTLSADPAFQELIATYRSSVNDSWRENVDDYFELMSQNRIIAARLINDKLNDIEDPKDVPFGALVSIHADAADRTGYPKRSVAVNVNVDFAAQLDRAIKRSGEVQKSLPPPEPKPLTIEHEPIRRRVA